MRTVTLDSAALEIVEDLVVEEREALRYVLLNEEQDAEERADDIRKYNILAETFDLEPWDSSDAS